MTEPTPIVVPDLLVTPADLAGWLPDVTAADLEGDVFTLKVLWGVSVLVRDAGSSSWTHANIPERAFLIAQIVAKNYYEHPTGVISDTTGPISERYIDAVVHSMELMPEQIEVLERLAADEAPASDAGLGELQVLSTTRGPLEMPGRGRRRGPVYVLDAHGSLIAYYDPRDLPAGTVIG